MNTKLGACECADPGCPCHGTCTKPATGRYYRPDWCDGAAMEFCDECGDDACSSGVFSPADDTEEQAA